MFKKIIITTLVLIIIFASKISADTYYVDTAGNNGNSGTQSTPWKTVQYGVDQLKAGDTLKIKPGLYIEKVEVTKTSGTLQNPITIETEDPDNKPTLRAPNGGDETRNFRLFDVSNYVVDSLKFTNFGGTGVAVENQNKDITNITIKNCDFINGKRDTDHILRAKAFRKDDPSLPNQSFKATQIVFINNYIEKSSPCDEDNPSRCNEIVTFIGNVQNSAIIGARIIDSENIGINLIGGNKIGRIPSDNNSPYQGNFGYYGGPKYIVYKDNYIRNNYKPEGNPQNGGTATQGLYSDGALGPVTMENNTVLYDPNNFLPGITNAGQLNGVSVNAEPSTSAAFPHQHKNFIIRNNYFDTGYFAFNIGVNQNGLTSEIDRVAVVHNVGINDTSNVAAGWSSFRVNSAKNLSAKNNIIVKNTGVNTILNTKIDSTEENWTTRVTNELLPTWEFDGNMYYHEDGKDETKFNLGLTNQTGFSSYQDATKQDTYSYFEAPSFVGNNKTLEDHYLLNAESRPGVALTKTVGSKTNTSGAPRVLASLYPLPRLPLLCRVLT